MNIYFSGIGGVGLGPLAEIALDAGYTVTGSDREASPMTRQLESRGVAISLNQDGSYLQDTHDQTPIDWFIYTAGLPSNHPELVLARELGLRTAKRDELLAHIIDEKNLLLIAVAGTHGKTTTTGMLIWAFKQLGIPISYSVGTTISFGASGKFDPESDYFVYECDEFDRNFLHFTPRLSLVTSIDYDHPDTYPTEDQYKEAFRQFISQSYQTIMWQTDANYIHTNQPETWQLQPGEVLPLHLAGEHNRRNATLVIKAFERLALGNTQAVQGSLETFPGTDRRFEKIADNLYSDYGHHPVEIDATLQMARELNEHVVLVYQPHQNVRQHEIRDQYTSQFELADMVYWLPTYLTRENETLPILGFDDLTRNITNKDVLQSAELDGSLWSDIQRYRSDGCMVLCMGAGTIDGWVRSQLV